MLTAGLGFSLLWKIFQKTRWIFAVDFFQKGRKMQKKNPPKKSAGKSASRKQKIRRPTTPQNPPARPVKPPSTRRVFSIEKVYSWRRLQSMDSGTLFGCLLGIVKAPMLKCTCNPSAAAGGRDKVCCASIQTTLLVKNVRFEETAQK